MTVKLYGVERSPSCRVALMTAKALGVPLTLIEVDPYKKANVEPEYLKLNPTHTIPTLEDNGFVLWDSHAISIYLVEKYGKQDSLYPKDLRKKAIVNQILALDNDTLFNRLVELYVPLLRGTSTDISDDTRKNVQEAYGFLETFLKKSKWLAGDSVTIADIAIVAIVSSLDILIPVGEATKLQAWFKACQELSWYSENIKGLEMIRNMINKIYKK